MVSSPELACIYSALILQDDDVAITNEKIQTILNSAGVNVEPFWPGLYAKALEGIDLKGLISSLGSNIGSGGTQVAATTPATNANGGAPTATAPAKDEKKVEKEESDEDMGFGLFD
uniref:Large ribosomal subunit protein P1 n=1 Tax=Acrobeloides nanus TaxID=290746 RepID=A0A914CD03_9BILA